MAQSVSYSWQGGSPSGTSNASARTAETSCQLFRLTEIMMCSDACSLFICITMHEDRLCPRYKTAMLCSRSISMHVESSVPSAAAVAANWTCAVMIIVAVSTVAECHVPRCMSAEAWLRMFAEELDQQHMREACTLMELLLLADGIVAGPAAPHEAPWPPPSFLHRAQLLNTLFLAAHRPPELLMGAEQQRADHLVRGGATVGRVQTAFCHCSVTQAMGMLPGGLLALHAQLKSVWSRVLPSLHIGAAVQCLQLHDWMQHWPRTSCKTTRLMCSCI